MAVLVFVIVATGYFLLRSSLPNYVFDDSRHMYSAHARYLDNLEGYVSPWAYWKENLFREFANDSLREYRPLSFFQHVMGMSHYAKDIDIKPLGLIFLVSVGWGLCAFAHFNFALKMLQSIRWSLVATLLFMTSLPVVTASWIIIMGWQWIVPLLMLTGLIAYLNFKQTGKIRWLLLFWFAYLIGPWFREFAGIGVFIVFLNELLFATKKSKAILISCLILLFHVIYPAFLPNLLTGIKMNHVAFTPVYKLGPLGMLSSGGSNLLTLYNINKQSLYHFWFLVPPILWCLVFLSMSFILNQHLSSFLHRAGNDSKERILVIVQSILFILLILYSIRVMLSVDPRLSRAIFPLMLLFLVMFLALRYNSLLALYSFLTFTPFLKVYTEEVHLAYALAPISIIIMFYLRDWFGFVRVKLNRRLGQAIVILSGFWLFIGFLDASLNVLASYRTVKGIYNGIQEKALWMKENIRKDSIMIGNFIDLRDILLYAVNHFDPYFTITPNWEPNQVETGKKVKALLDKEFGHREIYLIGAIFERLPEKFGYHNNHFLKLFSVDANLKKEFQTRIIYPYADPFKYFIPDKLTSFPGPPDLVDDYYVGKIRDRRLFLRETYTDYLLVKIDTYDQDKRNKLDDLDLSITGRMIDSYKRHNLFGGIGARTVIDPEIGAYKTGGYYVAFAQSEGQFDLGTLDVDSKFKKCLQYQKCFKGDTLEELKSLIDSEATDSPMLIEEGYKGFNIILYRAKYYALGQDEGPFYIEKVERKEYRRVFIGNLANQVKNLVDQSVSAGVKSRSNSKHE